MAATVSSSTGVLRSSTPSRLPAWFEPYTRWRFVGLPREFEGSLAKYPRPAFPHRITLREYAWVIDEWDRFALWSAWLDSGKQGPRPLGLWTNAAGRAVSPGWAGSVRRLVLAHRKPGPTIPGTPFPPPPIRPRPDVSISHSWVCMAENIEKALWYPPKMGIAYTADRAYPKPSPSVVADQKRRGQRVGVWCDCHSTFPDEAEHVRAQLGADLVIGEGESAAAFQVALDANLRLAWINISALTGAQKEAIAAGKIAVDNELYLNQDRSRADRENWENLPIDSRLIACYDAKGEAPTGQRFSFDEYVHLGKWDARVDSFYDPGATDDDRRGVIASVR